MALLPVRRRDRETETTGLARLHRDMDDLFRGFFTDWDLPTWRTSPWPVVDVREDNDVYTIKAKVPGCKAEDIDISVQGSMLVISGEKKEEQTQEGIGYYHSERAFGNSRREVDLACDVKAEKIEASHEKGVLTIAVPRSETAKPVNIKVRDNAARGAAKR